MLGVGGETYAESVVIDELRIARSTRRKWRALVAGERDFSDDVAVLIGQDFLQNFDVEFDLPQNVVRLFEPKGRCDGVGLAYWSADTALEVPIDVSQAVTLDVEVNGQRLRAMLDSGATSTLTTAAAARLGIAPDAPGVVPAGCTFGLGRKEIERWIAPIDAVAAVLPANTQTKANDNYVPTLAIEYFATPNVSIETICSGSRCDRRRAIPA